MTTNTLADIVEPVVTSGGTIQPEVIDNDYKYLAFPYSGTLTQTEYSVTFDDPDGTECDILIVGGGGAGGTYIGGGGGAGGVLHITGCEIPTGTYNISVGKGGNSVIGQTASALINNGSSSKAFGIEVFGGGYGGAGQWATGYKQYGANGGSGGAGGPTYSLGDTNGGSILQPDFTSSTITVNNYNYYGGNGASGYDYSTGGVGANGGGGAGGHAITTSTAANSHNGGNGADGKQIDIDGNNYYWGGGGGGGQYAGGKGGDGGKGGGGGGNGSQVTESVGIGGKLGITNGQDGDPEGDGNPTAGNGGPGTGGGGGGTGRTVGSPNAITGSGGSGIVIIRYKSTKGSFTQVSQTGLLKYGVGGWNLQEELQYFTPIYKEIDNSGGGGFQGGIGGGLNAIFDSSVVTGVQLKGENYSLYISPDIETTPEYENLYPKYQLEVNGNSKLSGTLTTGAISASGAISATGAISASGVIQSQHFNALYNKSYFRSSFENTNYTLYIGTPFTSTGAYKSAIIAEAITDYSRHNLHFCVNTEGNNSVDASISNAYISLMSGKDNSFNNRININKTMYAGGDGNFRFRTSYTGFSVDQARFDINGYNYQANGGFGWSNSSDKRLKEDIEEANYQLCYDNVKKLALKRFKYRKGFRDVISKDKYRLGYIAQEVQQIFPKNVVVSPASIYDDDNEVIEDIQDCLSIDVDQIQFSLYGAFKHSITKIEKQDTKIEKLEQQLTEVLARLETAGL